MKGIYARATLILMGFFAYLLLSITFYQNAMAAPVGADTGNSNTIGWWYEQHQKEDDAWTTLAITTSITTALSARAMEDCRIDGDVDYSCYDTRYKMLANYLVSHTDKFLEGTSMADEPITHVVVEGVFWVWVVQAELDEGLGIAWTIALYVDFVIAAAEKSS